MPGLTLTTKHLARAADELAQCLGRLLAAALVVRGDLRDREVGLIERRVDERDLRAVVGQLLDRRVHRLGVRRRDEHRVGLLGRDRVDDRRLQGGVELVRALEVERDPELLGLGLGSAVHRDVELVALDARDERHLVVLLGAARDEPLLEPLDVLLLSSLPQAATPRARIAAQAAPIQVLRAIVGLTSS